MCPDHKPFFALTDWNMGRLFIYKNCRWGTVCTDRMTQNEANVICRSMGFDVSSDDKVQWGFAVDFENEMCLSNGVEEGWFKGVHSPVWIDQLHCPAPGELKETKTFGTGYYAKSIEYFWNEHIYFDDCEHSGWNKTDCGHATDLGLVCTPFAATTTSTTTTQLGDSFDANEANTPALHNRCV